MYYYKNIQNGYIISIGTTSNETLNSISKEEYERIKEAINNMPKSTDTIMYKLKEDLTWEENEVHYLDQETQKDATPKIVELENMINVLTAKLEKFTEYMGCKVIQIDEHQFEVVKDEPTTSEEGTYLDPIHYEAGMAIEKDKWYIFADENIWKALLTSDTSEYNSDYFDIII